VAPPAGERTVKTVRNVLATFGAYWLSFWLAVPLDWVFAKLRITYDDGILSAIAMGIMVPWGRTLPAIIAGVLITVTVDSRKPERWALILAILYMAVSRVHYHWHLPPTAFDRISQVADFFFPAVACIAAAILTSRLQRRSDRAVAS
jgi:hypothetical protein